MSRRIFPQHDRQTVGEAVAEILRERAAGHEVRDQEIAARFPDCAQAVMAALEGATTIRNAYHAVRRAGFAAGPIHVLNDDELEQPISASELPAVVSPARDLPSIDGYELLAQIDAGGQGAVYKAVQHSTARAVAIKVLSGGAFVAARQRARFEREASVLASIDHPNVVSIIDRGRAADGSMFTVMPFIQGVALDEYIERNRPDLPSILGMFEKIARAVDEAHRRGIVHRDLKPSNILIDPRGEPHVMDFGLARDLATANNYARPGVKTNTGQIVGSLPWISPEQVTVGGRVEQQSDVYAIGVMLYRAVAGVGPYETTGPIAAVMANITAACPLPPSRRLAERPRERHWRHLDAVVTRCLAKEPATRYASAGALADELARLQAGEHPHAPRWRPGLKTALACAAIAFLGVAIAVRWPRAANPAEAIYLPANSVGMRLALINAGAFMMGSPFGENGRNNDEQQHAVRITHAYGIGSTEVTRAQFRAVIGEAEKIDLVGDDLPVTGVSWEQASAFCVALSAREHRTYRLPTEAEWEFACRAGSPAPFENNSADAMCWCESNGGGHVHPVAQTRPNVCGLYDMHGNAAEWVADYYQPAYPASTLRPVDDPRGPAEGFSRVVRGGSMHKPLSACRASARAQGILEVSAVDVGFRVVMELP